MEQLEDFLKEVNIEDGCKAPEDAEKAVKSRFLYY